MPAILKGIMDCMEHGPLTGSYARDVRVIVYEDVYKRQASSCSYF